jgi:hypothetical protein
MLWYPPYPEDIGTPVIDPAFNDTANGDITINYSANNLNINIQCGTQTDRKQIIYKNSVKQNIYPIAY